MTTSLERHLVKSIAALHKGADDYDVTLEVGQQPNVETFQAHSVILRAVSPYFKAGLAKKRTHENQSGFVFKKPNIEPAVFAMILECVAAI